MGDLVNTVPTKEQVKQIFNEVYNKWFTQYRDASTPEELQELMKAANEIDKKYPFKLCHDMLMDLLDVINEYCREGEK